MCFDLIIIYCFASFLTNAYMTKNDSDKEKAYVLMSVLISLMHPCSL